MKIVHLTTVHPRKDTRIYYRECYGLFKAGYEIVLLVSDGLGNSKEDGFQVIDIGRSESRIKNFFRANPNIIKTVKNIEPNFIHFHDPELIFVARRLYQMGYPVIFDIHENIALQILDKSYIPKFLRGMLSGLYRLLEKIIIQKFHLVIAENSYSEAYKNRGKSLTTVLNLPDIDQFREFIRHERNGNELFYIGGVSFERGLGVTLEALNLLHQRNVEFHMHFIGPLIDKPPEELLKSISEKVTFYGRLNPRDGFEISKRCIAGLSVLKPIKNYINSYPTKIFEYMAVALTVITSDFPLYRGVVEKYNTGYCVNPNSPSDLADRIQYILNNPDIAAEKAQNGLKIVTTKLNWSFEKSKLIGLYEDILSKSP